MLTSNKIYPEALGLPDFLQRKDLHTGFFPGIMVGK